MPLDTEINIKATKGFEEMRHLLQKLKPKRRRNNEIEQFFLPLKEEILQTISNGVSVKTVFDNLFPYYPDMSVSGFKKLIKSWRPGDNRRRLPFEKSDRVPKAKEKKENVSQ